MQQCHHCSKLGHPAQNCSFCPLFLDKKCHRLSVFFCIHIQRDFSDAQCSFASAPGVSQMSAEKVRSLMRIVTQNRFKNLGELHKEWTEAGVKASRATTHRRVKEFGYSCRQRHLIWARKDIYIYEELFSKTL